MEGLNNLKLNGELLASLYGRSIVNPENTGQVRPAEDTLKKTIIFFKDPAHTKLPEKQHKFLEQVLKACKVNIQDVDLVNLSDNEVQIEDLVSTGAPEYILSFGSGTGKEVFAMTNSRGTKYLNAPDLSELMLETAASRQLKGKLWTELKAMFNL